MKPDPYITRARHPSADGLWCFVAEREAVRLKKEAGEPWPWTDDETLQQYRFCNVRRADDYGTRWYLANVAALYGHDRAELLWATAFYRLVNNADWFDGIGGVFSAASWHNYRDERAAALRAAPKPNSAAYLTFGGKESIPRVEKLILALDHNRTLYRPLVRRVFADDIDLRGVWQALQELRGVGPFVALQVYRDLILTGELRQDDDSFCYLGPGARSGLGMLTWRKSYAEHYDVLLELQAAQVGSLERLGLRRVLPEPLTLGDLEHVVCEYRKWLNLSNGKGKKRKYDHLAPSRPDPRGEAEQTAATFS